VIWRVNQNSKKIPIGDAERERVKIGCGFGKCELKWLSFTAFALALQYYPTW